MCPIIKSCFYDLIKVEDIKRGGGKRDFNLANIIVRENKYVWKMHYGPPGAGADGRLPVGRPCSSAGLAQPRWQQKGQGTKKSCGQGGVREHSSSLYCTFRVSLLGRDMKHPPPLAWVGTPNPKQPFPKPPDLSHTNLHIPSVKENMGLGLLWL